MKTKLKIKTKQVQFDIAEPAPKMKIILWLLTGGRKGELFVSKIVKNKVFLTPPHHVNCRSAIVKVKENEN